MKKAFVALVLLVSIVTMLGVACADDDDKMTFDDVTFGKAYKIKGYASVTLLGFKFVDMYAQWEDGKASSAQRNEYMERSPLSVFSHKSSGHNIGSHYLNCDFKMSGEEADFAWLKLDIVNLQKNEATFMKDVSVKIIYDDEYEYDGWVRQFNYDFSNSEIYRYQEKNAIGWPVCLSPVDEMPIKPMYKGHYAFGCTLPNFVVEDKSASLRMVIIMDDHKLTYNIR